VLVRLLLQICCISLLMTPHWSYSLDLMRAYEAALGNDPAFRAAAKENEAAQANQTIGRSNLLPQISGNGSAMSNDTAVNGPVYLNGPSVTTTRAYPSNGVSVQITQPLFNLTALAQMRQGNAQAAQGSAKFVYSYQDLMVRVMQAYSDALYAQDNLAYLVAQRDAYREQLAVNERMLEKGEGIVTDALETKAVYEMAVAQVIEAQDQVNDSKRKLEAVTGMQINNSNAIRKLKDGFKPLILKQNRYDDWRGLAIENNPELRAATHAVEVARQAYEQQQAGHAPIVSAIASWGSSLSQSVPMIGQRAVTSSAGVQLTIPFYSGGGVVGRAVQAYANYEKAIADRDAVTDKITIELNKQFDLVRSSVQRIQALNRSVISGTELTKAMRKSVQGGQRINLDILVADKTLATSKRDLAQANYNHLLAYLKLKQQAGTLEIEDLEVVARFFESDMNMQLPKK